jgi:hypothetical protein
MKLTDIKSPEDIMRYIEGCVNDFEAEVSNKEETMIAIADLVTHVAEIAIKSINKAEGRDIS